MMGSAAAEADRYVAQLVETIGRLQDQGTMRAPKECRLGDAGALVVAGGIRRRCGVPRTGATPVQVAAFDPADPAQGGGRDAESLRLRRLRSSFRLEHGLPLPRGREPEGFVPFTYDGYTNEGSVISLAAHLAAGITYRSRSTGKRRHRVRGQFAKLPAGPGRALAERVSRSLDQALSICSSTCVARHRIVIRTTAWRPIRGRTSCAMSNRSWRGWPSWVVRIWWNPTPATTGRCGTISSSACTTISASGTCSCPGRTAFALLAGADGADAAVRYLLRHKLDGPLGLADSAMWATGADEPHAISPRNDFWNTGLGTMAMLEWLDGSAASSKSFAALPEVRAALDQVFLARVDVVGQSAAADKAIARLPAFGRSQEK